MRNQNFKEFYKKRFSNLKETLEKIISDKEFESKVKELYENIVSTLKNNNSIYFIGNGGSAADSSHLATEFTCKIGSKIIDEEKSKKRYQFNSGLNKAKIYSLTDVAAIMH